MFNNKNKSVIPLLCLLLLLTGCSCASAPAKTTDGQKWQEDWLKIGTGLGIEAPAQLTLLDSKEALAADGLYYATWVTGNSVPYENNEGDTIDLYDAQLYLLVNETSDAASAETNCQAWLASAEENYKILSKDTVICSGHSYTLITYDCISEDTPYARGVSAFAFQGATAVCAELTCVENYNEDLTQLLTEFLNGCHYSAG